MELQTGRENLNFSQVPQEPSLVGQLMTQDLTVPWDELEWCAKIEIMPL